MTNFGWVILVRSSYTKVNINFIDESRTLANKSASAIYNYCPVTAVNDFHKLNFVTNPEHI